MAVFDATRESYMLTEIDNRLVLFTNMRLNRDTVPDGFFCYDVRDSDSLNGSMAQIKPYVMVNHWGTILCRVPFPMEEYGCYYPESWSYLNKSISLLEFSRATPEQLTAYQQQESPPSGMIMK